MNIQEWVGDDALSALAELEDAIVEGIRTRRWGNAVGPIRVLQTELVLCREWWQSEEPAFGVGSLARRLAAAADSNPVLTWPGVGSVRVLTTSRSRPPLLVLSIVEATTREDPTALWKAVGTTFDQDVANLTGPIDLDLLRAALYRSAPLSVGALRLHASIVQRWPLPMPSIHTVYVVEDGQNGKLGEAWSQHLQDAFPDLRTLHCQIPISPIPNVDWYVDGALWTGGEVEVVVRGLLEARAHPAWSTMTSLTLRRTADADVRSLLASRPVTLRRLVLTGRVTDRLLDTLGESGLEVVLERCWIPPWAVVPRTITSLSSAWRLPKALPPLAFEDEFDGLAASEALQLINYVGDAARLAANRLVDESGLSLFISLGLLRTWAQNPRGGEPMKVQWGLLRLVELLSALELEPSPDALLELADWCCWASAARTAAFAGGAWDEAMEARLRLHFEVLATS